MTLAAGSLNRRITIQTRLAGSDAAGQPVDAWADLATRWADVRGETGMGTIRNGGDVPAAIKKYSFRVRFIETVNESMRIVYAGQIYMIEAVRMDWSRREWTDLVCTLVGSPCDGADMGTVDGGNAAGTGIGTISGGDAASIDGCQA